MLLPQESPCERLGSYMSSLWSQHQGLGAAPLCDRVFLTQAHVRCLGSTRDEFVIREVAFLMSQMRKRRFLPTRLRTRGGDAGGAAPHVHGRRLQQIEDADAQLRESGRLAHGAEEDQRLPRDDAGELIARGHGNARALRAERLRAGCPSALPATLAAALQRRQRPDGVQEALAPHMVHMRSAKKGAGVSTTRERAIEWSRTEEGRSWLAERTRLYKADDPVSSASD